MKNVLKKIGLWLGLFLLALILISFLLPSEIKVKRSIEAVSYTHLTLPTSDLV